MGPGLLRRASAQALAVCVMVTTLSSLGNSLSCVFLANLCFGQSSATWSIHFFLFREMHFAEVHVPAGAS